MKAVLSTTAKAKKHKDRKAREKAAQSGETSPDSEMDVDTGADAAPVVALTPANAGDVSPFPAIPTVASSFTTHIHINVAIIASNLRISG